MFVEEKEGDGSKKWKNGYLTIRNAQKQDQSPDRVMKFEGSLDPFGGDWHGKN